MKKTIFLLITCLFLLLAGCSRELPDKSEVTFSPQKPVWEKTLTVTFTPAKKSPLANKVGVVMQALFVPANAISSTDFYNNGKMNEIPMQKKGSSWAAEIVPAKNTGCIVFQFETEGEFENNGKKGWDVLLHSEDGKPVKGAYSALSQSKGFVSRLMDLETMETDTALALCQKELELYPDNWLAKAASINLRTAKAKKNEDEKELTNLEEELDNYLEAHPENLSLRLLANSYFYRSNPEKSARALKQLEKLDPKHNVVLSNNFREIGKIQDIKKRLQKLRSWEKEIWDSGALSSWYYYTSKALSAAEKWESLLGLAEKRINLIETEKPRYAVYTKKQQEKNKQSNLFSPLSDMAQAHIKLGNKTEAQACFERMSEFELYLPYKVTNWENYLQLLVDTEQWDKAAFIGQKAIEDSESNDKIVELFKTAYTKKTGDAQAAEYVVITAKKKAGTLRKEEIAKTFITDAQPAPEFSLKNLAGEDVSLASFLGKTVIVDFWATWCGPCKASFPYLQKFWEQHQNNPDVMVVAVNCREQKKGEERVTLVEEFMSDNNYTFPVLLDLEGDEIMTAFGVSGIPTKFFVGPDGNVYFKDFGFHGPGMTDDMNIQLEMIRDKTTNKL